MKRTFCTVVRDESAEPILSSMAEVLSRARHWSFREIHRRGRLVKDVKREALVKFGITARHFNGVRFDLDQAVNAWRGGLQHRQDSLRERIKDLSGQIERLEAKLKNSGNARSRRKQRQLRFTIHQKKRHLGIQRSRLATVEADLAGPPKICFGGRDLLRRGEVQAWRDARSSRICLVGAGCESAGNQSAQWDGETLTIRLPDALGGERVRLQGISFRYGQAEVLSAMEKGSPLTWLLFRDRQGQWQARVTIEETAAKVACDAACGIVGVDLNVDHLAIAVLDRMGNPVARETIPFPTSGVDANKASGMIGEAVKRLTDIALERGCAIAVEKLDFSRKKANLKSFGKRHARRLSGFAYARFYAMLEARCARLGIEMRAVNPAYTSIIGKIKYAPGRAMSAHHAAALVIGRRAMGFGERLVCMTHGTLACPGRNRPRHVWGRWRGARPVAPQEGAQAPDRTAGSVRGTRRSGAHPRVRASAAPPGAHGERTRSGHPPARGAVARAVTTSGVTADT